MKLKSNRLLESKQRKEFAKLLLTTGNDNLKKKMDHCWESRSVLIYHHPLPEWDDEAATALTVDDVLWSYFNLTDSNPELVSKKLTRVVNKVKLPRGRDIKRGRPKKDHVLPSVENSVPIIIPSVGLFHKELGLSNDDEQTIKPPNNLTNIPIYHIRKSVRVIKSDSEAEVDSSDFLNVLTKTSTANPSNYSSRIRRISPFQISLLSLGLMKR
jgi:hypothetical protein